MPGKTKSTKKEKAKQAEVKNIAKKSAEAEEEKKVEKKPAIKYGYSINLAGNKQEHSDKAHAEAIKEDKKAAKEEAAAIKKETEVAKKELVKDEEAIKEAETINVKDVEHIKYSKAADAKSSEEKAPEAPADAPASAPASCCAGAKPCAGGVCPEKAEEPKKKFSWKEFWQKVKSIKFEDVNTAINNTFTVKNAQACAATFLTWVDSAISFITTSKVEGRNEVMQKARVPMLFGFWVAVLTFVVGGFWSGFAPLNSASIAMGTVVTVSKKQLVQYRDGGILKALYVKEGDHVKPGQVLAQMDDAVIRATFEATKSMKANAEKELEAAEEYVKSIKALADKGYASRHELLSAETKMLQHKTQVDDATHKLVQYEEALQRTTLKSPIKGIVTQVDVTTIGATIQQGSTLMTITPSEEELIVEAYVPQRSIEPVHVGLKAKVQISAFMHKTVGSLDGIVTYVSSDVLDIQQQSRTSPDALLLSSQSQNQMGVYKVKIAIDKEGLKKLQ